MSVVPAPREGSDGVAHLRHVLSHIYDVANRGYSQGAPTGPSDIRIMAMLATLREVSGIAWTAIGMATLDTSADANHNKAAERPSVSEDV